MRVARWLDLLNAEYFVGHPDWVMSASRHRLDTKVASAARGGTRSARPGVAAGPGEAARTTFGPGPAGPDVVVGECLAAVHAGRLGGGAVNGIQSDQVGRSIVALPSDRECADPGRPRGLPSEAEQPRRHTVRGRRSVMRRFNRHKLRISS
ncbi:MAG TPA: hypothetical protein VHQ68_11430 [Propionibacteriaceae bacterium]|nr:hypothetical protein [Propionibacteriaceae bacterium]